MKRENGSILYSPSDLIVFLESEFASWMDRFYLEFPDQLVPDEDDESLKLLQARGLRHEADYVEHLVDSGKDVYEVPNGSGAYEQTLAAMAEGRQVIFQGVLQNGRFAGRPDFLLRVEGASSLGQHHYEVWDTKLALKAKPYFLIQLCCYAEMVASVQGLLPPRVGIVLGSREELAFRTCDFLYFYRRLKEDFLAKQQAFDPSRRPVPGAMENHRRWSSHAQKILDEKDDLSRVANIRRGQIKKLEQANIVTLTDLATTTLKHVPRMEPGTFETLRAQANLQHRSAMLDRPLYEVLPPDPDRPRRGLALLPPESELDVYFDIEGFPHAEGGLEYLFGASFREGDRLGFRDWWGHDRQEEKQSFQQFMDWVYQRWEEDPGMHIYHYGDYEISALRRLMGRHGTRERQVDDLLRNEVFVNLYTVVRQGLRVGEPGYSIKNIEHLYRGKRSTEVGTALDSVVYYQRWLEGPDGAHWMTSKLLNEIREYNKDDCDSTAMLAWWLRDLKRTHGLRWEPPPERESRESPAALERAEATELAEQLLAHLPSDPEMRHLQELLAYLLEFHWRESKPVFWAKYDRHEMTEAQLIEDPNCLGGLKRTAAPARPEKQSLLYEYSFNPSQDTKLDAGKKVFFAHDLEGKAEIFELDDDRGAVVLKIGRSRPAPPDRLSLIPDEFVDPKKISQSIYRTVSHWANGGSLPQALEDFLLRRRPRIQGNPDGPIIGEPDNLLEEAIAAVKALQNSTLCIQGPPGSGKTFTASKTILSLLEDGQRVGVTSNSHKAISHLLNKVAEDARARGVKIRGTKIQSKNEDFGITASSITPSGSAKDVFWGGSTSYQLIGGTAWAFSDEHAAGMLDYLFVDEAGQVSIANLVGMAPSTRNIVLMGDQMQLSQPIQGAHPGDSGKSILEYLLGDHQTIPDDFGIFLGTTYRMHPEVCRFISSAVYEDRLHPEPHTARRHLLLSGDENKLIQKSAGVLYLPVEHEGNTQGSDEEAELISDVVQELLGASLQEKDGSRRPLRLEDILIVAPYNMQVRILKNTIRGARIGTVDKFQGQEAPVVIVSMCASDGAESSRGMEFLFNKNRLNVAISRAQALAIVVGSPTLSRTACSRVDQMELVNLYCRIVEEGALPQQAGRALQS